MIKSILLAASALAVAGSAAQAELLTETNIPSSLAVEIAQNAVAACAADKYNVTAAVVDRAGVLRALVRADKCRAPHCRGRPRQGLHLGLGAHADLDDGGKHC